MKLYSLLITFLFFIKVAYAQPQPTVQDCLGAIPICQNVHFNSSGYSGTGNYNDIPWTGCLAYGGETNSVWYTFTVQTSGLLRFILTPNGSADYDWALFNLTNAKCSDLYNNFGSLVSSCNASGYTSATGISTPRGGTSDNELWNYTNPFNRDLQVYAGQTYVLMLSKWSGSTGYTLDFGSSTASIFDQIPPVLNNITTTPACGTSSLTFNFSENIQCSTIASCDFTLTGPGGPYNITSIYGAGCAVGGNGEKNFTVNFTPPIAAGGTYNFNLVASNCNSVTDLCGNVATSTSIPFTISAPVLTHSSTPSTCAANDGTATVNASGGNGNFSYQWNTNPPQYSATATNLGGGTYYVTVTSAGCSSIDSVTVTATSSMSVSISNVTHETCGAGNGSATVTPNGGTPPINYQWSTSPFQTNATAINLAAGTYTVTVSDGGGCNITTTATITTTPAPVVSSAVTDALCNGSSTGAVDVTVSGSSPYTYLWNNGSTIEDLSFLPAGNYSITVTDVNACITSSTVTVGEPAVIALSTSSTPTGCNPINGTATVVATGGTPAYAYSWNNGEATSSISGLSASSYTIVVTDIHDCTGTASVTVTSHPLPTISINPSVVAVCNGQSVILTASGGMTYSWFPNNALSSTTDDVVTANPSSITTYTVTGTDANGCTNDGIATVTIYALPFVTVNTPPAICFGQSVSLSVNGANTYLWNPASSLSSATDSVVSANPSSSTTYTVTGTDLNGCTNEATTTVVVNSLPTVTANPSAAAICQGKTMSLTAGGASTYEWSPSNGLSSTIGDIVLAYPTSTQTYVVTGTDGNGCTNTASMTLTIYHLPPVSATSAVICSGSPATLSAGGAVTYTWSPSSGLYSTTGSSVIANDTSSVQKINTYTVTGIDANGCSSTANSTLTINPLPIIKINPPLDNICPGQSLILTASGAVTYDWSPAAGLSATTGAIVTATPSVTTFYTVVGTDANGCTNTETKLIILRQIPTISLSPVPADICNGGGIMLAATSIPACGYSWSPSTGLSSTYGSSVTASPTTTTTYTVTTGTGCCINTATITVTVNQCVPMPVANFTSSDTVFCTEAGQCINFFDHSTGSPTAWEWRFPGAIPNNSSQQNPTNICYLVPGTYAVTQIVSNITGSDTLAVTPLIIFGNTPPIPVATVVGKDTLVSTHGSSYQWYLDGNIIAGATDSFYVFTQPGTYAVRVTDSLGCSSISNGVVITGVPTLSFGKEIRIYPNPVFDEMTVVFSFPLKNDMELSVTDMLGQELRRKTLQKEKTVFSVSMLEFSSGIYVLKISDANINVSQKFIVLHR